MSSKGKGKGKRKHRRPGHGGSPPTIDRDALLAELASTIDKIDTAEGAAIGPLFGAVHQQLLKLKHDPADAARLIAMRDADALRRTLRILRGEEVVTEKRTPPPQAAPAADVPHETMKHAMRAFRKRLKLTRLDHESKLGVGPMSGGRHADFDAILPPREFDDEVWRALVAAGELQDAGRGFYMLAEDAPS